MINIATVIDIRPSVSGDWKSCLIEWILFCLPFMGLFMVAKLYFHGTILLYSVAPWACENLSQLDIFFFHLFSELPSLLLTGRYLPTYLPYLPVKINEISKLLNN